MTTLERPVVASGAWRDFTRVCSSAWLCLRRPAFLLPSFAAVMLFAVLMVVGIFLSAARPGGSRMSDTPIFLADLAQPDALATLAGGIVSITGSCVLAIAAAHLASAFAGGTIRVQLVRQPRRTIWLFGNLAVVSVLTVALTVAAILAVVVSGYLTAAAYDVPTGRWASGEAVAALAVVTANLSGSMVGFALLGAGLAVVLRSAIATIGFGLCYALFESLFSGVFGSGARFLPVANLGALATGGNEQISYQWGIAGSLVVMVLAVLVATTVIRRRDVLD